MIYRQPGELIIKDPDSVEPEMVDWTIWLAELGDGVEIVTSTWVVTGGDATAAPATVLGTASPSILPGALTTKVYLTGGTLGRRYRVTNKVITNTSPVTNADRSFYVKIADQ
jgi:hypothetical protein